jgi:tetratricopeptide (TPR) repeat protein
VDPRTLCLVRWLLCAAILALESQAVAQETEAGRLFREGIDAAHASRWDEAEERFQRSYDLSGHAPVLLNLAAAQAERGRLREALDTYARFSSEASPELRAQHGAAVDAATREIAAELEQRDGSVAPVEDAGADGGSDDTGVIVGVSLGVIGAAAIVAIVLGVFFGTQGPSIPEGYVGNLGRFEATLIRF